MKKTTKFYLSIIILTAICSCDDIFEEDISDSQVILITPEEGAVIETDSIMFVWELLDDASEYHFQLRNELSNTTTVDSLVVSNFISLSVAPNSYSWRVKAKNFAYETDFTFPRNFQVLQPDDLSDLFVNITYPPQGEYFKGDPIEIVWESLDNADNYAVDIYKVENNVSFQIFSETIVDDISFSIGIEELEMDAEYNVNIKASNDVSETQYSSLIFYLDTSIPSAPILLGPDNDSIIIEGNVIFEWAVPVDQGAIQSSISGIVEVSNSASFDMLLFESTTNNQSITYEIPNGFDELWWRIRLIDEAGNESEYSDARRFIIE